MHASVPELVRRPFGGRFLVLAVLAVLGLSIGPCSRLAGTPAPPDRESAALCAAR
jgi:hypothetical protein